MHNSYRQHKKKNEGHAFSQINKDRHFHIEMGQYVKIDTR